MPADEESRNGTDACLDHDCTLREAGGGCRLLEGVSPPELVAFVRSRSRDERRAARCVHWGRALLPCLKQLRWSPQERMDRGEALSELWLLVHRVAAARGDRRISLSYLVRSARNWVVDRRRKSGGRLRCGNCRCFLPSSAFCGRQGSPYWNGIGPRQDPRALDPPCDSFQWIWAGVGRVDSGDAAARAGGPSDAERVERALVTLAEQDPEGARLLRESGLEGRPAVALARERGWGTKRVRRTLARVRERLRAIYEDL